MKAKTRGLSQEQIALFDSGLLAPCKRMNLRKKIGLACLVGAFGSAFLVLIYLMGTGGTALL